MKLLEDCELLEGNKSENDSDTQFSECDDCHRFDICYKTRMGTTYMTKEIVDKLLEIRNWIKEKYPNSLICHNDNMCNNRYENDETYKGTALWPSTMLDDIMEFFEYEILGMCGCGDSDATIKAIHDYLKIISDCAAVNTDESWKLRRKQMKERFGYDNPSDNGVLQYMAYDLDDRGLTDHGSNIDGAWTSALGDKCLFVFDTYLKENDLEEEKKNE